MCKPDVVRAWKDEEYRMSLSESELMMLPTNPAGLIEISDRDLGAVAGGEQAPGVMSFQVICSYIGGCNSDFIQICSGDWAPCTGGPYLCPWSPVVFD
jgi:mersacidin/lichenicidin family type 2 lantibiotic